MENELNAIVSQAEEGVKSLRSIADFEAFKAKFVGPNGHLTSVAKGIGKLSAEERPKIGKLVNQVKNQLESILDSTLQALEQQEIAKKLGPPIDPSLPSPDGCMGSIHPLTAIRREVNSIFKKIGFTVAEGPEIDTEWFCFDALNTPDDHPARDIQDTLFLPNSLKMGNVAKKADERYILRTHTSTVQIRTMLAEKPPLRIISPGRAFRRDTVDATHSANFHQVEGLFVDKDVTIKDLKAVLDFFVRELIGKDVKTRFRPSFFPFTEPSFEMDLCSPNLGKLSNQWVEIMGCGMVDPNVFQQVGIDPEQWTGYAFGMGMERLAIFLLGIDDLRYFYQNDLRFLKQFN